MLKDNKVVFSIAVAFLVIGFISLVFFTTKTSFHDTAEYITAAKEFAGINNVRVHSVHSFAYPFFISFFLKVLPFMQTINFINFFWLALTALILYFYTRDKKVFLLFSFSPVVWFMSIQLSPILPTAFFFTLGYILLKKYFREKSKYYLILSALSFGLCMTIYDTAIILVPLFMLIFFYDKSFKEVLLFALFLLPTFAIRFALDLYYFGLPVYSLIRYFGNNLVIILAQSRTLPKEYSQYTFAVLIMISPLLFYLFKVNIKKYLKEIIFLSVIFIFFMYRAGVALAIEYYPIFAGMIIIMLADTIDYKKVYISIILSLLIIVPLVVPYFGQTEDYKIKQDMITLSKENNYFISEGANTISAQIWQDKPFIFWLKEYKAEQKGNLADYNFETNSKISLLESLQIGVKLKTYPIPKDINPDLIIQKSIEDPTTFVPPPGYIFDRCLSALCVYKKDQTKQF